MYVAMCFKESNCPENNEVADRSDTAVSVAEL
jgi:hypothetical protein